MHPEAREYAQQALRRIGGVVGKDVLEIGSVNINGDVPELRDGAHRYVGIDPEGGPGVDIVTDAAGYEPVDPFDVVASFEVLEHAKYPKEVIDCAYRSLKPGGHLILTCASTGRKPHGARGASDPAPDEHYRNIPPEELSGLLGDGWEIVDLDYIAVPGDVRVLARKLGRRVVAVGPPEIIFAPGGGEVVRNAHP